MMMLPPPDKAKMNKSARDSGASIISKAGKAAEYTEKDLFALAQAIIQTSADSIDGAAQKRQKEVYLLGGSLQVFS